MTDNSDTTPLTPQELFLSLLQHVMGSAFDAAGYSLQKNAIQQAQGLFRYVKTRAENRYVFVEYQILHSEFDSLSRFQIALLKNSQLSARAASPNAEAHTLAWLIHHQYNAPQVLPSDDYWWVYKHPGDLGLMLFEAGKLLFGYGIPWVEEHQGEHPSE